MKIAMRGGVAAMALLAAASTAFPACGREEAMRKPPREVSVARAERGTIANEVLFTGNIVADEAVEVYPRASGRVARKVLKEGDPVRRGQAILEVDRDEIGLRFRTMIVDSPIDGFVGSINVDEGQYVYDRSVFNAKPVAVVVKPGRMRVRLDIPERYLGAVLPGTPISLSVDSLGGAMYEGSIATLSPVVDRKTRTANVEAIVPNPDGRLLHGMFARTKLAVERREGVIVVPISAVSWEGDRRFVYRVADGRIARTPVVTGLRNDAHVEIVSGLSEGDMVAAGDLLDLKDGEEVSVKTGGDGSAAGVAE